ncbi:serine/threonine-protein kinase mig-15-like [Xenopus tropicalis]|uniref:Serine/threonine-protein kinase mig-15-like n=1 Tax=Xenopus tropicalis TaxID=8364 RepID=A0A8J1IR38_XENTR|nr:serine/threonine-protein kinase mig-15-like [Xenopus tropicalis]
METGPDTGQTESSATKLSEEEVKEIEEEDNITPLSEKYPEPGRYLKLGEPIGQDPNGVVYIGWHQRKQREVAIIIIQHQKKQQEIEKEVGILQIVSGHRNIVDFYGAFYHKASSKHGGLWIATELCTGATVEELIATKRTLGERWIAYICKNVITGLNHLEEKNIIHHDIKPEHIVISSSGEVKIGEFCFATIGGRSASTSGTMAYMAPEVLAHFAQNSGEYDHKADIWSLGIAAIQMAEGHLPFRRLPKQKLIQRITTGPVPSLPSRGNWSDEFRFFISECLQRDPGRRPSARQLLTHPFIAELRGERGVQRIIAQHLHRGRGTAHSHYSSCDAQTVIIYCSHSYNILLLSYIQYHSITKATKNKD